ncbi:GAF domain-containing protein [Candidatus Daviesbacteria bacterium]|nr:GAF domain-containing protein [Candidatus Daviesbacteria bacterium]
MNENTLEKIHTSALKFLTPLNLDEVYKIIVLEAIKLVDAEFGSLLLYQNKNFERVFTTLPVASKVNLRKKGSTYTAFKSREAFVKQDKYFGRFHPQIKNLGIKSNIFIPLSYKRQSVGVLIVNSFDQRQFQKRELEILKLFGSLASLAIRKTQLNEESRKAVEDRDTFISMAAHELRTPLTTISGYVQLLSQKLARQPTNEGRWSQELVWETSRLSQLINEIVAVNKIQANQFSYNWEECQLEEIINRAISDFHLIHPYHVPNFQNGLAVSQDKIVGDSAKLLQVMINLLDNAAKFSEAGSEISINLKAKKKFLILNVKDHGKGIPKKDLSKIFDGFYRDKNNMIEGMGLGLFLAKNIIEYHHGSIKVKSKLNFGTNIEIKLPRVKI